MMGDAPRRTRRVGGLAYAGGMPYPRWLARLSRVPIRARLTLAFVAMMATVLAAAGVFLYVQFRDTLDAQIDTALQSQAADVGVLVAEGHYNAIEVNGNPLNAGCRAAGCLGQVYAADGQLLASTPQAGAARLLTVAQAALAAGRRQQFDRDAAPLGAVRVLAVPVRDGGEHLAMAVADSLAMPNSELARLRALLLIAGPLALLLASVGGTSWRARRCVPSTGCACGPNGSPSMIFQSAYRCPRPQTRSAHWARR